MFFFLNKVGVNNIVIIIVGNVIFVIGSIEIIGKIVLSINGILNVENSVFQLILCSIDSILRVLEIVKKVGKVGINGQNVVGFFVDFVIENKIGFLFKIFVSNVVVILGVF